jgi:hypothetical protein
MSAIWDSSPLLSTKSSVMLLFVFLLMFYFVICLCVAYYLVGDFNPLLSFP